MDAVTAARVALAPGGSPCKPVREDAYLLPELHAAGHGRDGPRSGGRLVSSFTGRGTQWTIPQQAPVTASPRTAPPRPALARGTAGGASRGVAGVDAGRVLAHVCM